MLFVPIMPIWQTNDHFRTKESYVKIEKPHIIQNTLGFRRKQDAKEQEMCQCALAQNLLNWRCQ